MQLHEQDKNNSVQSHRLLGSLARELKNPLVLIARQAELEKPNHFAFSSIQTTAEKTLQLVDSYLLMAQTEYGQQALPLETIGIGAIVYELMNDLRAYQNTVDFSCQVKDANVMAHREGLKTALWCLSELALIGNAQIKKRQKLIISTKKDKEKISISILSSSLDVTHKDINLARQLQGVAHLAMGNRLGDSGIYLAIADALADSLGSGLQVRKNHELRGLSFDLTISRQLQLV